MRPNFNRLRESYRALNMLNLFDKSHAREIVIKLKIFRRLNLQFTLTTFKYLSLPTTRIPDVVILSKDVTNMQHHQHVSKQL